MKVFFNIGEQSLGNSELKVLSNKVKDSNVDLSIKEQSFFHEAITALLKKVVQ